MSSKLHARLSPSGAHKWMPCVGSVAMEDGLPDDSSEYADEGTAAHALGSMCLESGKHPAAFTNRKLIVINGVYWPGSPAPFPPKLFGHKQDIRREFIVDSDMVAAVNTYVQRVKEYAEGHELMIEQAVPVGHITGEEGATGTSDAIIITNDGVELQAHDLKFGRGVRVDAEENEQGLMYLLGCLEVATMMGYSPTRFRFVIHQPRLTHLSEWDCGIEELMAFKERASKAAKVAFTALKFRDNWIGKPDDLQYLVPGEKQCRFCKAKASCPALATHVTTALEADFKDLTKSEVKPEAALSHMLSKAQDAEALLGLKMKAVPLIELFCNAVAAETERRLLQGIKVPGFKLVAGRKGNRQWSDTEAVEKSMKAMRLKHEEMFTYTLISPATAETLLKDQPKRWATLSSLVTQSDGKKTVAPESDKRPALSIAPVEFEDEETNDAASALL